MFISMPHYWMLLSLSSYSVLQIWSAFSRKLLAVIKERKAHGNEMTDWSVVHTAGSHNDDLCNADQRNKESWIQMVGDMKVNDLFHSAVIVLNEYREGVTHKMLWLSPYCKRTFWLTLSIAYSFSVWNIYVDYGLACRQWETRYFDLMNAFESLYDDDSKASWEARSYYVNTPDFVSRYLAVNVACWIGWHLIMKRVHHGRIDQIRFDRKFLFLFLWTVASTMLMIWMLYQVWMETKSPFKVLGLHPSATLKEAKRAYRKLIRIEQISSCTSTDYLYD